MKLVEINLSVKDEVKRHLIKQTVEMFNIEYTRYLGGIKITNELVDGIIEEGSDIEFPLKKEEGLPCQNLIRSGY